MHAHIALGDYHFNNGENAKAKRYYVDAKKIQDKLDRIEPKERTRLLYRITWAAYRSADSRLVINSAFELLNPEKHYSNIKIKELITSDSIELLSHALFEKNDINLTERTLSRNSLKSVMSRVSLSLMQRYASVELDNEVSEIGQFTLNKDSLDATSPEVMWLTALSLKRQNLKEEYIAQLKNIVNIASEKSLWRIRNQSNIAAVKELEKVSKKATERLAKHFYKYAMTHNSPSAYRNSAEYFTILNSENDKSSKSLLKIANAYFLANDLNKAVETYDKIAHDPSADVGDSKLALYLKVVTLEKHWRLSITQQSKSETNKILRNLAQSTNQYANRYPNSDNQKELLKLLASTYQDNRDFAKALNVWDRILLSKPSKLTRASAIRGITLANIKIAPVDTIIEKTQNFIDLENWKNLPSH